MNTYSDWPLYCSPAPPGLAPSPAPPSLGPSPVPSLVLRRFGTSSGAAMSGDISGFHSNPHYPETHHQTRNMKCQTTTTINTTTITTTTTKTTINYENNNSNNKKYRTTITTTKKSTTTTTAATAGISGASLPQLTIFNSSFSNALLQNN